MQYMLEDVLLLFDEDSEHVSYSLCQKKRTLIFIPNFLWRPFGRWAKNSHGREFLDPLPQGGHKKKSEKCKQMFTHNMQVYDKKTHS